MRIDNSMDVLKLGDVLARSGYFQDARDAAQCIVKVLAGRELGLGPVASMTGIYIVKGRVTLSANLIAATIKRSGRYNYKVLRMDDKGCEIEYFEQGESIGKSAFTDADAKAAGLGVGDNWRKFPRNMYFARTMSNGAKWYCPDVFAGPIYTPDELGAQVEGETGEAFGTSEQLARPVEAKALPYHSELQSPETREADEAEIAGVIRQIELIGADVKLGREMLDRMANKRFERAGGLNSLSLDELKAVEEGLLLRRAQMETEAAKEQFIAACQEHGWDDDDIARLIESTYPGKKIGDLNLDHFLALTDEAQGAKV
jgi:hypothetical protein